MILNKFLPNYAEFDSAYSFLFNSYYNSIGQRLDRSQRGLITRPAIETVYAYRKYVDSNMLDLIENHPSTELEELLILGLNHEQQHQELIVTDLKYTFSLNPTYPSYADKNWVSGRNTENGWLKVVEGLYEIGHKSNSFCFDNELGHHKVFLEAFQLSKALVSNGEFIEFIDNGAYSNPIYWLDDGWSWIQENKLSHPLYWQRVNNVWHHFTLSGLEEVESDAILTHISYYEALAFATYKDCRLPTEFEWEVASKNINWGQRWEWTNSAYLPYPRFKIKAGAVGEYNGKFMINQMILRGGSVATAAGHSRYTYRNFFQPETRWQFNGIRLAK
jgi:ergothioneine biosynthesis protein EgtB